MGGFEKFSIFYILLQIVLLPFKLIGMLVDWFMSAPGDLAAGTCEFLDTDPPKDGKKPNVWQTWDANVARLSAKPVAPVQENPVPAGRSTFSVDDDELWKE